MKKLRVNHHNVVPDFKESSTQSHKLGRKSFPLKIRSAEPPVTRVCFYQQGEGTSGTSSKLGLRSLAPKNWARPSWTQITQRENLSLFIQARASVLLPNITNSEPVSTSVQTPGPTARESQGNRPLPCGPQRRSLCFTMFLV